jgi:hypothetical protein
MARDLNVGVPQLASPNQAAALFNPDGRHPVRQKHLFVVRFLRETQSNDAQWRDGLTFVVKSMDRPAVQATVEEINQYNRKRLINTGVKYQPVNCTFYDTADGAAMDMWIQYARYYFMDYHHEQTDYRDDILHPEMGDATGSGPNGSGKRGYGFNIRDNAPNEGIGSQHFFHKVVVYQLWGNEYTSYELLNPRITSFTPDDLTYDNAEVNTIQVSLSYEAIHHGNTGRPQELFTEPSLRAMFSDGPFRGNMIEVLSQPKTQSFTGIAPYGGPTPSSNTQDGGVYYGHPLSREGNGFVDPSRSFPPLDSGIARNTTSSEGGVLSRFGSYDWGTVPNNQFDYSSRVPQAIEGSQNLARLLSGSFSGARHTDRLASAHSVEAAIGKPAMAFVDGLVDGVMEAARATGLTPKDHAKKQGGLEISNTALAGTNKSLDGTHMLGQKNTPNRTRGFGSDLPPE